MTSSTPQILFIVGSLRKGSHNKTLATHAHMLLGDRAQVSFLDYDDVPLFNQDNEFPPPACVTRVRQCIQAADAVWIFTPEYNFSFPAPLKNVLDWVSRPLVAGDYETPRPLTHKPVVVSGAGGRGATAGVRKALFGLLTYLQAQIIGGDGQGFVLPARAWSEGIYELSDEDKERLSVQAQELLEVLSSR